MKIIEKIFLLIFLLIKKSHEECGFNHIDQKNVQREKIDLSEGDSGRFLQSTDWAPIRMYLDFTVLEAQRGKITDELINNIKTVMNRMTAYYASLIKVKPSNKLLRLYNCQGITPGSAVKAGVQADVIIFPYVEFSFSESTEAASTHCANEASTNRPLAGYVAFNQNINFGNQNAMYYNEVLVFHEINHILFFSPYLYDKFIDSSGKLIPESNVISDKMVNGVTRKFISSPKVLEKARQHFNCQTMTGVELENQGGDGTASSHWEERIMEGEIMIGQSYGENVLSDITLAFMEDSGWYKPNYYTGGLFKFGKNQGCDFLNEKCVTNGVTKFPNEFTTTMNTPMCFASRTGKGYSSLYDGANPPVEFQYFSKSTVGSSRVDADYCPVAIEKRVSGWSFPSSCWMGRTTLPTSMGEKIGDNSLCFISSLTPTIDRSLSAYTGKTNAICYDITCNSDRTYNVNIGPVSIKCPTAGGPVTASGFDGTLQCADYNLICTKDGSCGNMFDCINKKKIALTPDYGYTAQNFQTIDSSSKSIIAQTTITSNSTTAIITNTTVLPNNSSVLTSASSYSCMSIMNFLFIILALF